MNFLSTYPIITLLAAIILFLVGLKIAKWIFWGLGILAIVLFVLLISIF
jgi:hypothetical protein